jgi:hypothetical protein
LPLCFSGGKSFAICSLGMNRAEGDVEALTV